jgi:hypothetical protein
LYSSQNIIRVIKSRRMRRVDHIALRREMKNVHKSLVGRGEGSRQIKDFGLDWRIK